MVFDSTDENKEVLERYAELWDGIKNEIETINGGKEGKYDDLPLNKLLKLYMLTIVVRSALEEDSKYYPQIYLDECLYKL